MTSSGDGSKKGKSERKHKRSSIAISDGVDPKTDIMFQRFLILQQDPLYEKIAKVLGTIAIKWKL